MNRWMRTLPRERSVPLFSHLPCCLLRHTDVPTPELVGRGGREFGLLVRRMSELIAAFAGLAPLFEQALHGADRAEILSFIVA